MYFLLTLTLFCVLCFLKYYIILKSFSFFGDTLLPIYLYAFSELNTTDIYHIVFSVLLSCSKVFSSHSHLSTSMRSSFSFYSHLSCDHLFSFFTLLSMCVYSL
jgi:hypothetical protein